LAYSKQKQSYHHSPKEKGQLLGKEVQNSREFGFHVERLSDIIKQKYTILEGTLPINFIKEMMQTSA